MTTQEKAKAYDEALERAKKMLNSKRSVVIGVQAIETIFPELRESEDERMIGVLKRIVERYAEGYDMAEAGVPKASVLAWLEKQKEPHYTKRNALFENCVENCDPKTVEEVNKRVDDILNMSELSAFEQALTNFIGYWEDDEERWPSKFVKKHGKHILDMAREELQKEQKPAEWSGFDEDCLKRAIWYVENPAPSVVKDTNLALWLKSLRPQPHWKPSEEQMKALVSVTKNLFAEMPERHRLESLYEQLKKLM